MVGRADDDVSIARPIAVVVVVEMPVGVSSDDHANVAAGPDRGDGAFRILVVVCRGRA